MHSQHTLTQCSSWDFKCFLFTKSFFEPVMQRELSEHKTDLKQPYFNQTAQSCIQNKIWHRTEWCCFYSAIEPFHHRLSQPHLKAWLGPSTLEWKRLWCTTAVNRRPAPRVLSRAISLPPLQPDCMIKVNGIRWKVGLQHFGFLYAWLHLSVILFALMHLCAGWKIIKCYRRRSIMALIRGQSFHMRFKESEGHCMS